MIIAHIRAQQTAQVVLVDRDHMIQHLPTATAHPTLRYPILPRRAHAGVLDLQPGGLQKRHHVVVPLRVAIQDYITIRGGVIGNGGRLYGTTIYGGTAGLGTVFELTPPKVAGETW